MMVDINSSAWVIMMADINPSVVTGESSMMADINPSVVTGESSWWRISIRQWWLVSHHDGGYQSVSGDWWVINDGGYQSVSGDWWVINDGGYQSISGDWWVIMMADINPSVVTGESSWWRISIRQWWLVSHQWWRISIRQWWLVSHQWWRISIRQWWLVSHHDGGYQSVSGYWWVIMMADINPSVVTGESSWWRISIRQWWLVSHHDGGYQ